MKPFFIVDSPGEANDRDLFFKKMANRIQAAAA
jgi:hypothetical protein